MSEWMNVLIQSTQQALEGLFAFLPKILLSALIIIVGWIVAKIIQKASHKFFEIIGVNRIAKKAGIEAFLESSGIKPTLSWIFSRILFWSVFLMFFLPISDVLGLAFFADLINQILGYIPNVVGALLIILAGSWGAKVFSGIVRGSSVRLGSEYAEVMGTVAHAMIMLVVFILALSQLNLDASLLSNIMLIVLGAIVLALAAAFAFGSIGIMKNVIAGIYVNRHFTNGSYIRTTEVEGTVAEIGPIFTVVETGDKRKVSVPNNTLIMSN